MIIACDTNVLISALIFPGSIPDRIFRAILSGRFQHCISPDILTELQRILLKKFALTTEAMESFSFLILQNSKLVYPSERLNVVKTDETDNRILECAFAAKADFIITGDKKHLLPLKKFKSCNIISPREFVETMNVF